MSYLRIVYILPVKPGALEKSRCTAMDSPLVENSRGWGRWERDTGREGGIENRSHRVRVNIEQKEKPEKGKMTRFHKKMVARSRPLARTGVPESNLLHPAEERT
jgi:hypothetical protein